MTNVTHTTATLTGYLDVAVSDISSSRVTVCYSDTEPFDVDSAESVFTKSFDENQNFIITLLNLKVNTKYNYCVVAEVKSQKAYSDVLEFTTLQHPTDNQSDLIMSSALDLSSSGSANCYVVSKAGLYRFKTVKGNGAESLGGVASASILWETFGTSETPEYCDLIRAFCYKDGYIAFQTTDTFKEGNAVIAVKDANGAILWSWHIWLTDQPQGHEYYNNAGTMMDRNLGAISATYDDVAYAVRLSHKGGASLALGHNRAHGYSVRILTPFSG